MVLDLLADLAAQIGFQCAAPFPLRVARRLHLADLLFVIGD